MPQTHPTAERRTPRPWWFRLGGWALALVMVVVLTMLVVDNGTYGATEHTVADTPASPLTGEPAPTLTQQASDGVDSYLAGPVVATISEHGAVAKDVSTGEELWHYARSDTTVCAHRTNAQHVTLIYASGDRCDEAVSFDPATGQRQWQRTIEAVHPNQIIWADSSFISLDPAKTILFEDGQGFERFTLDNSKTDHIEGEHTTCENMDAAGSPRVATLQRCRATADEQWVYQIVVNEASDGDPREAGRSYLTGLVNPAIEGVAPDGTTILRDANGILYTLPLGATDPLPISGIPAVSDGQAVNVLAMRGTIVISTESTAYALDRSSTGVIWVTDVIAAPYGLGNKFYVPTEIGIDERDAITGQLVRTIGWDAPIVAPAEIIVSGPLVGLRDAVGLRVYS